MGLVEHGSTRRRVSLAGRTLVGRAPGCVLRLDDRGVSAEHAAIVWTGAAWTLRDLGSTNGTVVDGRKLEAGERVDLREGSQLLFAGVDPWRLVEVLPPVASAREMATGALRLAEDGLLVLPDPADPVISVFEDEAGGWLVEADEGARRAVDQETITIGGQWVLSIPPPVPGGVVPTTRKAGAPGDVLGALTLRFSVSQDDEYVELDVILGEDVRRLGARVHHYLLLTLARARIEDASKREIPAAEQGWLYVDDLVEMLKTDLPALNLAIFRARQQLAQAGVTNAGALVERRLTTKQIRLGTSQLEVRLPR